MGFCGHTPCLGQGMAPRTLTQEQWAQVQSLTSLGEVDRVRLCGYCQCVFVLPEPPKRKKDKPGERKFLKNLFDTDSQPTRLEKKW